MIRQAVETILFTREGQPAALAMRGFPCSEHEAGIGRFAKAMGFVDRRGERANPLKRKVTPGAWLGRRASLLRPAPGVEVLTLGRFAGAPEKAQVSAIVDSPAAYDAYEGRLFGRMRHRTPLAIEEPFMDLVAHSDAGLAAAFDDKDVLVGGGTPEARDVVQWLAGLFAAGEARLLGGRMLVVLCDRDAGCDLAGVSMVGDAPPGYGRRAMRCDWRPRAEAA